MFSAVLDTSVLWPSLQRDFLLSMAVEGLYRPLWSEAILAELGAHEALKLTKHGVQRDLAETSADRLIATMREHFQDALVVGWEPLEGSFGLPDPDDEHVLAAALIGGAGVIVTDNHKHFPATKMPETVQVLRAREFAADTVDLDAVRAARALCEIAHRHRNPRHSPNELLNLLVTRYAMDDVHALLRPVLDDVWTEFNQA